jgi:hypothetical protein
MGYLCSSKNKSNIRGLKKKNEFKKSKAVVAVDIFSMFLKYYVVALLHQVI